VQTEATQETGVVHPALAVFNNSRKAQVHTVTAHHQHDLSHTKEMHMTDRR